MIYLYKQKARKRRRRKWSSHNPRHVSLSSHLLFNRSLRNTPPMVAALPTGIKALLRMGKTGRSHLMRRGTISKKDLLRSILWTFDKSFLTEKTEEFRGDIPIGDRAALGPILRVNSSTMSNPRQPIRIALSARPLTAVALAGRDSPIGIRGIEIFYRCQCGPEMSSGPWPVGHKTKRN